MKSFEIPDFYRSPLIHAVKTRRKQNDKLKKDFSPTELDFGSFKVLLARHFGFCYGVENAIEIAFKTVYENPGKRIFLLSEMIHNPQVNHDLKSHGVQFIFDTLGKPYIDWSELKANDCVIVPAFGTTLETEERLRAIGIDPLQYNTTCPFVEKVWNRSQQIGEKGYSIIIHGKPKHEETRATFSHSSAGAPSLVINDMAEAQELAVFLRKEAGKEAFYERFKGRYSEGFNPETDLERIGVVNQTTMLASDTQAIADYLKQVLINHYNLSAERIAERFADTRDTLCYATLDNQQAIQGMLQSEADCALIVGGYNSSNTSHLVELCEPILPTFFIENETNLLANGFAKHFDLHTHREIESEFLPKKTNPSYLISAGASCPDAVVERVIRHLQTFHPNGKSIEAVMESLL
ncbi:MAG: 4-hydroxy-3-methylbut-2-enyl diphosphate reductase [Chitinophagaceae bacterium]